MSDLMTGALNLPHEVLIQVFSSLDQQQLGIVSTVSRCWRVAALVALKSLCLELTHQSHDVLHIWLKHRAQQLQHLQLTHKQNWRQTLSIQLPLSSATQLRSLTVNNGLSTDTTCKALPMLRHSLTSLRLCSVEAQVYHRLLSSIATLSSLQCLDITRSIRYPVMDYGDRAVAEAASSMWRNLQHLTSLTFSHADDSTVQELTRLRHLRHLDLQDGQIRKAATLSTLPECLTYLGLAHHHDELDISDIIAQSPLPKLQQLIIPNARISSPYHLSALRQLKVLSMAYAIVQDVHQLLSVLPQLSNLRDLDMTGVFGFRPGVDVVGAEGVLAQDLNHALQLPQLTRLEFCDNQIIPALPAAGGQLTAPQLFSGWHLPELLELHLSAQITTVADQDVLCGSHEVDLLVKKCPKLCYLDLNRLHSTIR